MKVSIWICAAVGLSCGALGFLGGVASTKAGSKFFENLFRTETTADLENPKKLRTDFYNLQYPGNWSLDKSDPDFDLENTFSINTAGDNYVSFTFGHYESEPAENVEAYVSEYSEMMKNPEISDFSTYGTHTGKGKRIKGRIFGLRTTIDLFSGFEQGVSFTIVEWVYDEDTSQVEPGLQLIETSFTLKETPTPVTEQ